MLSHPAVLKRLFGSAMLQWCLIALPLLWMGALVIELSYWHLTRQRVALLAQRAVEDASLSYGTSQALKHHLQRHLPSHMHLELRACITDDVPALMRDFKDKHLGQRLGSDVIRHNHVREQHKQALRKWGASGLGTRSRRTISDANTLNVTVEAVYRPRNPWIRMLLREIPLRSEHRAIMQSHRKHTQTSCVSVN